MSEQDFYLPPLPIFSDVEIGVLPDPEWLIENILVKNSLGAMYGPSGHGKTFTALGMAMSIGTGQDFLGHRTSQGAVIYVYAEGAPGLKNRVSAWKHEHGLKDSDLCDVHLIPVAVDLQDPRGDGLDQLIETIRATVSRVSLVVIDPVSKCFGFGDENNTQHMNTFMNRCAALRDEFHCSILLVHHTGHEMGRERGSSAFRADLDTLIRCARRSRRDQLIVLSCEKQRDGLLFDGIRLHLKIVEIGLTSSCVVECAGKTSAIITSLGYEGQTLLEALAKLGASGATSSDWQRAAMATGMSKSAFKRTRKELATGGYVTDPGEPIRGFKYTVTPKGLAALGDRVQSAVDPTETEEPLGSGRVQTQLVDRDADSVGSKSGPNGFADPLIGSGSNGGACRAPHEPLPGRVRTEPLSNGDPRECQYCHMPYPFSCGFCSPTEVAP